MGIEGENMNVWESFRDTFLLGGDYEYLGGGSTLSVPLIVLGIFLGIAIAFVATTFTKRVWGEMVRRLLAEEIHSAENAKTLSELSLGGNLFLRRAVKGNVSLRRVVACREEEEFLQAQEKKAAELEAEHSKKKARKVREASFRVNPDEHHFYIPEDCRYMASVKFDKQGTSLAKLIILLVLLLVCLFVVLLILPRLMTLLDGFVGTMQSAASSGNNGIVS